MASNSVILAMTASRFMRHGCQGFFKVVLDTQVEIGNMENVPIVGDYVDVFSEELPGLPLQREIEFLIDLMQDTNTISTSLYQRVLAKLKELKD